VKNWRVYRSRFIDPVRIEAGVLLARLTSWPRLKEYGVPAEIIVGNHWRGKPFTAVTPAVFVMDAVEHAGV
jgi:hypothetical protein